MKKFGMELEFFVHKWTHSMSEVPEPEIVTIPDVNNAEKSIYISSDEFPVLGEVRSRPFTESYLTIAELMWRLDRVRDDLNKIKGDRYGIALQFDAALGTDILLHRTVLTQAIWRSLRNTTYSKGAARERNIYGKERRMTREITAGLHIHFSDGHEETSKSDDKIFVPHVLDVAYMVRQLDGRYKDLIKESGRQPGWYEMKAYGFEYRSLPNYTPLDELCMFLEHELKIE